MPSVTATWLDRRCAPGRPRHGCRSLLHRRKLTGPLAAPLTGREPLITFVTYGELTKWAEIRRWGARRREELAGWLSGIPVLPGDEAAAAIWGRLSAAAVQRGRPRLVNDMWVAACQNVNTHRAVRGGER